MGEALQLPAPPRDPRRRLLACASLSRVAIKTATNSRRQNFPTSVPPLRVNQPNALWTAPADPALRETTALSLRSRPLNQHRPPSITGSATGCQVRNNPSAGDFVAPFAGFSGLCGRMARRSLTAVKRPWDTIMSTAHLHRSRSPWPCASFGPKRFGLRRQIPQCGRRRRFSSIPEPLNRHPFPSKPVSVTE
jgi:hypothetical protein